MSTIIQRLLDDCVVSIELQQDEITDVVDPTTLAIVAFEGQETLLDKNEVLQLIDELENLSIEMESRND